MATVADDPEIHGQPIGHVYHSWMEPPDDSCEWLSERLSRYPDPQATDAENARLRDAESLFLSRYAGKSALTQEEARELFEWRFEGQPQRQARAMMAVDDHVWAPPRLRRDRPTDGRRFACDLIVSALATADDRDALLELCPSRGGVLAPGVVTGSVILAACQPDRFVPANIVCLAMLRELGMIPVGPVSFTESNWLPYLQACRTLSNQCGMPLWDIYRALRTSTSTDGDLGVWAYMKARVRTKDGPVRQRKGIIIHRPDCPRCQFGAGNHGTHGASDSAWRRFRSVEDVRQWADQEGNFLVRECHTCLGSR